MKYENFDKVKSIVEKINKVKSTLDYLDEDNISVKIQSGTDVIMIIDPWSSSEHDCKSIAANFITNIILYYESELKKFHSELETM